MNERIKELADQAELTIRTGRGNTYMSHPEFNKKFAELIVRECAELTIDYKNESYYNGWLDYRDEIKQHFGVEE